MLGDADKARYWFDRNADSSELRSRSDYFYAGSVLYAVDDYQGAIDKYSMMTERTDSIGQIANYHLGYSYIQTKNKVAAMEAFRDASKVYFDPDITEDAYLEEIKAFFAQVENGVTAPYTFLDDYETLNLIDRIEQKTC